ncbi:MAG: hypothetical protein J0H00_10765 [Burkholderiales bacterium]|nr:hypothetical protein [Burkholderiales bacterium]
MAAYLVAMIALSAVVLLDTLSRDWSAAWLLIVPVLIGAVIVMIGQGSLKTPPAKAQGGPRQDQRESARGWHRNRR